MSDFNEHIKEVARVFAEGLWRDYQNIVIETLESDLREDFREQEGI